MKKFLLVVVLAVGAITFASAQPRAIGGRLGYGVAVSYQHGLGERNMVNLDVDFPGFYGIGAAATYDWIFPITSWQEKGSWNWYAGVGAGLAFNFHNYMSVGVAGRIGVEYNFWFPMQLSLDWRPVIGPNFWFDHGNHNSVGFHYNGLYDGIALGIRYLF
ncbi:MAG: hypothetical protein ACI3Z7_07285 [Candidatus Aphodosoma sp.]